MEALFRAADVVAVPELKTSADEKRRVYYPWTGVIGFRPSIPDRDAICFSPGAIDGIACDAGGMFWHYQARHPDLRVRAMAKNGPVPGRDGDLDLLAGAHQPHERRVEVVAGAFLHLLGGSGWDGGRPSVLRAKRATAFAFLDRLLDGDLDLGGVEEPVTSPWPGQLR